MILVVTMKRFHSFIFDENDSRVDRRALMILKMRDVVGMVMIINVTF